MLSNIEYLTVQYGLSSKLDRPSQFDESGEPLTRQDLEQGDANEHQGTFERGKSSPAMHTTMSPKEWKCGICDFVNKKTLKSCVLCGTEEGFVLTMTNNDSPRTRKISVSGPAADVEKSFNRQRSFAIRRLNVLNSRQRGARNRSNWIREIGADGKRYWARRDQQVAKPGTTRVLTFESIPSRPEDTLDALNLRSMLKYDI